MSWRITTISASTITRGNRCVQCQNSNVPDIHADTAPNLKTEEDRSRHITWTAAAKATVKVKETKRSVEDYMALPASEYSVLAANQIVRLSETEFRCDFPKLNFFGTMIQPILFVDVTVYPSEARSEIVVRRAETVGSETAEKINGTFSIYAINRVSAGLGSNPSEKTLNSQTNLEIEVKIPDSKVPLGVVRSSGNFILQNSLNLIVPTFVRILAADFRRWSEGDNSRDAVEGAKLE